MRISELTAHLKAIAMEYGDLYVTFQAGRPGEPAICYPCRKIGIWTRSSGTKEDLRVVTIAGQDQDEFPYTSYICGGKMNILRLKNPTPSTETPTRNATLPGSGTGVTLA